MCAVTTAILVLSMGTGCSSGGSGGDGGGPDSDPPPHGDTATAGAYLPDDGLIVVEFESGAAAGSWATESSLTGFTGTSYLRWAGANQYSTPAVDAFGFDFWVDDPGTYQFRIHNRHDHADATLANDLWVRMDGGQWVKTFSWQRGQWTWVTQHEFSHSHKPDAEYTLAEGNHRIEFSGRSTDFCVDRFHLFDDGVVDPMSTAHPESGRAGVSGALAGPGTAGMVGADDGRAFLVELRASDLSGLADGPWLGGVTWSVPGASFADGTGPNSLEPKLVVDGGAALPVHLTLTNVDGDHYVWSVLNVEGAAATVSGDLFTGGVVELEFGTAAADALELVGPAGEFLQLRSVSSAQGRRVTFEPASAGEWSYRGRSQELGEQFTGAFVVVD